ncbi:MAG: hypothetical protein HY658_04495 [Actinobacteria bacterium]|nr:hypothetical protein [Actinomycetota bacterium]
MRRTRGERQIQFARGLGLLFCLAGFTVIAIGWNGMAKVTCPDCQLPYLLSAGASGLGLIVFGVGLLVISQIRAERVRLGDYVQQLSGSLRPVRVTGPEPGHGNGDGRVVAGRSTYHRLDCKLVSGKPELEILTVEGAMARSLEPCRVCGPPGATDDADELIEEGAEEAAEDQAGAPR